MKHRSFGSSIRTMFLIVAVMLAATVLPTLASARAAGEKAVTAQPASPQPQITLESTITTAPRTDAPAVREESRLRRVSTQPVTASANVPTIVLDYSLTRPRRVGDQQSIDLNRTDPAPETGALDPARNGGGVRVLKRSRPDWRALDWRRIIGLK